MKMQSFLTILITRDSFEKFIPTPSDLANLYSKSQLEPKDYALSVPEQSPTTIKTMDSILIRIAAPF